ncbi:MAG: hypothetical protein R3B48_08000 [Kofleriaceae bacterium]
MAFSRATLPPPPPTPEELTARMVGIGMRFAAEPDADAEIESTLLHASALGMEAGDLRVLAVLTTWLGMHHPHVNADRLVRLVAAHASERVRAYWAAVATWLRRDRRLARLVGARDRAPIDLLPTGTAFQLQRRGDDERFAGSRLRVPRGTLRDRPEDVLAPELLVQRHAGYRHRVLLGPSFRADVWTILERSPDLSVAEVARAAACSFATAWQTTQDHRLLRAAGLATTVARPARAGHVAARASTRRGSKGAVSCEGSAPVGRKR